MICWWISTFWWRRAHESDEFPIKSGVTLGNLPSGNLLHNELENHHWNRDFFPWIAWWFSIVMWQFTRWYFSNLVFRREVGKWKLKQMLFLLASPDVKSSSGTGAIGSGIQSWSKLNVPFGDGWNHPSKWWFLGTVCTMWGPQDS